MRPLPIVFRIALGSLLLATPFAARAQQGGQCLIARIPAPFILPDGSTHEAGEIRICMNQEYAPVTALHRVYANGMPVGLFVSWKRPSEARDLSEPHVLFHRLPSGALRLVGYVWPETRRAFSYLFRDDRSG
jgi:hypothetical protein